MAGYSGWKALERKHAKRMRGERLWRPDYGDSAPDGENDHDVWDCKYTIHGFNIATVFERCYSKYVEFAAGRRFHLVISDKTTRSRSAIGDLVVLRASDYAALLEKAGEL